MDISEATPGATREFNAAEIGALAHLYRGEIYRSTAWRNRLDNTTNWAVAGLGLAMSISKRNSVFGLRSVAIARAVSLW